MASIQDISSVPGRSDSLCESSKARTKFSKWSEADGLSEVGLPHSVRLASRHLNCDKFTTTSVCSISTA